MGFINYEKIEEIILEINKVVEVHKLNRDEVVFIANTMIDKARKNKQQEDMNALIGGSINSGLLGAIKKKIMEEDE